MMTIKKRQSVVYVHHTRDCDGDVILYFRDTRTPGGQPPLQSSPVISIRRSPSAVVDCAGRGGLGKYILTTQNSDYEIQIAHDLARHIIRELEWRFSLS
jgi:hypothetical protein